MGLLSPSERTAAGYRLYTDEDLARLQQILALRFLGLSLEEIRSCLRSAPSGLRAALTQQKAMLREWRGRLETVLHAVEEAERLLGGARCRSRSRRRKRPSWSARRRSAARSSAGEQQFPA